MNSGSFPPLELPGFDGTTSLSVTPYGPGLSLAGCRLSALTVGASRVALDLLFHTCRRHYPGGSSGYFARTVRMSSAFPESQTGRLRITLFEACSAFTDVTACMLAKSPIATLYTEGFGDFVTSITAPIATGWSDSCRMGFAPIGDLRLFTAH